MKKFGDFTEITQFNVNNLTTLIHSMDNEWFDDQSRQTIFKAHQKTFSIMLTDFPLDWNGYGYPTQTSKYFDKFEPAISEIISTLETYFNGKVGRSLFTKLPSRCEISTHVDRGYYLEKSHRCHIPIITNDEVIFRVDNTILNLEKGVCYRIDNNKPHSVINSSDFDRIHLIVDIIPNSSFMSV